jgi:hypothetical protein
MRKKIRLSMLAILAVVLFVSVSSCKKDENADAGNLPRIEFRTGTSSVAGKAYTAADASIYDLDTCVIGIKAWKAETPDVLKTFTIVRSESGVADTTILNQTLTTAQQDTFYTEYYYVVPRPGNRKQTFKFSVINRDGLIGTKSLTVTTL